MRRADNGGKAGDRERWQVTGGRGLDAVASMTEEKRVAAVLTRHSLRLLSAALAALAVVAVVLGAVHAVAAVLMVCGAAALATRP